MSQLVSNSQCIASGTEKKRPVSRTLQRRIDYAHSLAEQLSRLLKELSLDPCLDDLCQPPLKFPIDFYEEMGRFEKHLIERAMRVGRTQTRAAALLKLNPTTLNTKLKRYSEQTREQKYKRGAPRTRNRSESNERELESLKSKRARRINRDQRSAEISRPQTHVAKAVY